MLLPTSENDLLPVYVSRVAGDNGEGDYEYSIQGIDQNGPLRLWDKVGNNFLPVSSVDFSDYLSGTPSQNEFKFYVEATHDADFTDLTLTVTHDERSFAQKIYVRPFTIDGPANVPDFSVYEYKVQDSVASRQGTQWAEPGFGEKRPADQAGLVPEIATDKARLFWNQGAKIAKARYQATADYVWARDINVVKIVLGEPTVSTAGQMPVGSSDGNPSFHSHPNPAPGQPQAIEVTQEISQMVAPPARDGDVNPSRGIQFMVVGFTQVVTYTQYSADYGASGSFTHKLEGESLVDGSIPWYTPEGVFSYFSDSSIPGFISGSNFLDGEGEIIDEAITIAMGDSPGGQGFQRLTPRFGVDREFLQTGVLELDFDLTVSVGTSERHSETTLSGNRYTYFRRAELSWDYEVRTIFLGNDQWVTTENEVAAGTVMPKNDGALAFVTDEVLTDDSGVPLIAGDAAQSVDYNIRVENWVAD